MKQETLTPGEALAVAGAVVQARYPEAAFAYVAGSIMRGQGTRFSDIDLVVVFDRLEAAYRESFLVDGVPVEAFVHDPQTLAWFIQEDAKRGRPSMLNMVVEGVVIGEEGSTAQALRDHASALLAAGPAPLASTALDTLRYEITDALDDLQGDRPASEILAIGAMLHPRLVELALRGRGRWYGTGKWAPRLLNELDASLGDRFDAAFRALFTGGDTALLIDLAEAELALQGGRLFDGDRRCAPASWRCTTWRDQA
ncbi:nucleotidyltransferase domain-containing protein [Pseudomonas sp. 147P]|nr:nucleotidyltransferase domain-containing protein [Pseudomonas sp. 147P]MEE1925783.1 nucleotidyltransferase domain-containing protein [Pseudomonas sp. 147P]